jgi:predicted flap endonuclease-1-like 5' DNA nuclease
MIEANWLAFLIVLSIGIAVAWWLFRHGTTIQAPSERRPDALDEGAPPASRNQALIDAPPTAELTPLAVAGGMAGLGEIIAIAAQDEVEEHTVREAEGVRNGASAAGAADDLNKIKGIGPKLVTLLNSLGIDRYAQIAGWSEEDLETIDAQLGAFAGRARRDSWVEQANLLASGDTGAYEAKFGKL